MTSTALARPRVPDFAEVAKPAFAVLRPLAGAGRMLVIREEIADDVAARERLLDASFGPQRFAKTSEVLRAGRLPARGLALTALEDGVVVGTVRLWHVAMNGRKALLLGPLAVAESHRALGVGGALMREAIARATMLGHAAILLVGDEPYYQRFGFSAGLTTALDLPGPVERARFLGLELRPQALAGASGMVRATGVRASRRAISRAAHRGLRRAA